MADSANITTSPAVAALRTEALAGADRLKLSVQEIAERLRDALQEIHGGDYRIQIDHECGFVFVVAR